MVNGQLERIPGNGWEEALAAYKAVADDLHAGRTPKPKTENLTVADLCNHFLTAKLRKRAAGELGGQMFQDWKRCTDLLVSSFGKTRRVDDLAATDFAALRTSMAKRWGPVRLGNEVSRVKSVFKFGVDNGLLDRLPRYGSEFRKPERAVLRRHRANTGLKMFEAAELRRLLDMAFPQLKAMILLGLNCGFGNHDCATVPLTALDLEKGWVDFPRPKTGIARRCPLWAETVTALRAVIAARPQPKESVDQAVFLQKSGRRWVRETSKARTDQVSRSFADLLKKRRLHRPGLSFYSLRHVFRTVADGARDPVAIDLIMGHTDSTMAGHYRERVDDHRLVAVVQHVHDWLYGTPTDGYSDNTPKEATAESHKPDGALPRDGSDAKPMLRLFAG
jgi:integrase